MYNNLFKTCSLQDGEKVNYILSEHILKKYFTSKYTNTNKFRHILVDEAQDLPGNWLELLDELLNKREKSNMWIFEDPFQVCTIKICRKCNKQIPQIFFNFTVRDFCINYALLHSCKKLYRTPPCLGSFRWLIPGFLHVLLWKRKSSFFIKVTSFVGDCYKIIVTFDSNLLLKKYFEYSFVISDVYFTMF